MFRKKKLSLLFGVFIYKKALNFRRMFGLKTIYIVYFLMHSLNSGINGIFQIMVSHFQIYVRHERTKNNLNHDKKELPNTSRNRSFALSL